MDSKLERLKTRTQEAVNIARFIGYAACCLGRMAWQDRRKWHPDYVPSPKAISSGKAVFYEDLWLWQRILGRL